VHDERRRPAASEQPLPAERAADANDNRPALDWVAGNTYDHYAEHIDWINQLVKNSSVAR
jgi:hypothetical protein